MVEKVESRQMEVTVGANKWTLILSQDPSRNTAGVSAQLFDQPDIGYDELRKRFELDGIEKSVMQYGRRPTVISDMIKKANFPLVIVSGQFPGQMEYPESMVALVKHDFGDAAKELPYDPPATKQREGRS